MQPSIPTLRPGTLYPESQKPELGQSQVAKDVRGQRGGRSCRAPRHHRRHRNPVHLACCFEGLGLINGFSVCTSRVHILYGLSQRLQA